MTREAQMEGMRRYIAAHAPPFALESEMRCLLAARESYTLRMRAKREKIKKA